MLIGIVAVIFFIIAVLLTIKYKFMQFKSFSEARKILFKDKEKSSYQAFMVSLASHMGTGNIVGISTAIIYGGAGSIFWMWVFTLFSSVFSVIENTLAQKFKVSIDGEFRGGACYYIRQGIKSTKIALVFAIFLVLSNTVFFQPLQVNTISETLNISFNIDKKYIFIILALFAWSMIFKGTKRIVKFSETLVPIMTIGYLGIASIIVLCNIKLMPNVLSKIFTDAFNLRSITSGFAGSCLLMGFKRSLFSNETGLGTMPSISAMADIEKPLAQGYVQTVGIFIDTIVMCSLTGFIILLYDFNFSDFSGCDLILSIFIKALGEFGRYLSIFFLLAFALSTVVSEYYLGESNLLYITENYKVNKKIAKIIYKSLFLCGILIGTFFSTKQIWYVVDYGMLLLGSLNIYAIIRMRKFFEEEVENYKNILKFSKN